MPHNGRISMNEWLKRPWPEHLGDTLVCNSWGYFTVIAGRKAGPYKDLAEVKANAPKWFMLKYARKP